MLREILVSMGASLILISVATAQPGPGIMAAADELGLTEEQMEKISDMGFEHKKAMIQKKAGVEEAKLELKQLLKKKAVDEKAALSIQERISGLKSEMARMKLQHKLAIRKLLSPEQLDKLMKMHRPGGPREMKHRFREHGEPGMGHPMGMGPGPGFDD